MDYGCDWRFLHYAMGMACEFSLSWASSHQRINHCFLGKNPSCHWGCFLRLLWSQEFSLLAILSMSFFVYFFCRWLWKRSVIVFVTQLIWFKVSRSVLLLWWLVINHAAHRTFFYCLVDVCWNVILLSILFSLLLMISLIYNVRILICIYWF